MPELALEADVDEADGMILAHAHSIRTLGAFRSLFRFATNRARPGCRAGGARRCSLSPPIMASRRFAGLAAELAEVHVDAAERRPRRQRHHVPVVEADDGDIAGHARCRARAAHRRRRGRSGRCRRTARRAFGPRRRTAARRRRGPRPRTMRPLTIAARSSSGSPASPSACEIAVRGAAAPPRNAPGPVIWAMRLRPRPIRCSTRKHAPRPRRRGSGRARRDRRPANRRRSPAGPAAAGRSAGACRRGAR